MEQASGSADSPSQFWATFWAVHAQHDPAPDYNWEITEGAEWELAVEEIPEATHPQDFGLHKEYCFACLSAQNLALHDLVHGSSTWGLDLYECSSTSEEVVVHGQPVKRRSPHSAYCHCGQCDWIWFSQGWECWPVPYIEDID